MQMFRRSLVGYSKTAVARAMRQTDAEHRAAMQQTFQELQAARSQNAGLQSQLDRLQSELQQTDQLEGLLSDTLGRLAALLSDMQEMPASMGARVVAAQRRYHDVIPAQKAEGLREETTA